MERKSTFTGPGVEVERTTSTANFASELNGVKKPTISLSNLRRIKLKSGSLSYRTLCSKLCKGYGPLV